MFNFFFKLFFLVFPLGQIPKVSFWQPEIKIALLDLIVFLIVFLGGLKLLLSKKKTFQFSLSRVIIIFLLIIIFSFLINFSRYSQEIIVTGFAYLVRLIVYWLLYFVIVQQIKQKEFLIREVFNGLIFAGATSAILGLFQYFLYPDLANLRYLGWDIHYKRVFGTFFDPGFLAAILGLTLIILGVRILSEKSGRVKKIALWLITFTSFLLTYTRSAYLAFIVVVSLLAIFKKKFKLLFLSPLIFSFILLVLPRPAGEGVRLERTVSAVARINNWKETTEIIKENWLWGTGFNFLSPTGIGIDSSLLFIWATSGIFGFLSFLGIFCAGLKKSFLRRDSPESLIVFLSLIFILTTSLFLNTLFYHFLIAWMAMILATIREQE